jgi:hypothetical protein
MHWNDMLLTQKLRTCRAVPPCRSETTREAYHTHPPSVQFLFAKGINEI